MSMVGVYKILCNGNGRVYIGSSINIEERWGNHLYHLHRGDHDSPYLQRSFLLYGQSSLELEVLEETTPNSLRSREQYYLDTIRPWDPEIGFNTNREATSVLGYRHTPETLKKLREAGLARARSGKLSKFVEVVRRNHADPEVQSRRVANITAACNTPELREMNRQKGLKSAKMRRIRSAHPLPEAPL
jgi:group I intron endonuclease